MPLFVCFTDLQKNCVSVDPILLWQLLTRIGVPPQIKAIIRSFHDGIRACVRLDDGVCSDSVQGGARATARMSLSPLLFNIFFVAVLTAVFQRFGEDTVTDTKLVHPKEPPTTSMGPESAMDYVRRAVWGMLFADDACVIS